MLRSAKGVGPYLEFLRTPGVKTAPDRVHLDLLPYPGDDKEADVARLRALGATDLDLGRGEVLWTCLTGPEGHEFCVCALPRHPDAEPRRHPGTAGLVCRCAVPLGGPRGP